MANKQRTSSRKPKGKTRHRKNLARYWAERRKQHCAETSVTATASTISTTCATPTASAISTASATPAASATSTTSATPTASSCATFTGNIGPFVERPDVDGNRIVALWYLISRLQSERHGGGLDCTFMDMVLEKEVRRGLLSSLKFKCSLCNKVSWIDTADRKNLNQLDYNTAAVEGTVSSGGGFAQLSHLTAALDIPCMSPGTYIAIENRLRVVVHETAWKSIEEAGEQEKQLALAAGDVDDEGVPLVTVIADGQWSKRSYKTNYNALSGSAAIIGERTRKVLFVGVRNKYCVVCARSMATEVEVPQHECFMNWTKASTAMEADVIADGFNQSMTLHGVKFHKLIGDGDSSIMARLRALNPYGVQLPVKKIECRNHLLRNLCQKIRQLEKVTAYPVRDRKFVSENFLRLRRGVICAARHVKNEAGTELEKINRLRADIQNVADHVFGSHSNCRAYFCEGAQTVDLNRVPLLRKSGIYDVVQDALNQAARHAWSLLQDVDNNACESFNSVINKFIGGKRINYSQRGSYSNRVESAVVSYNSSGEYLHRLHKAITQKSPGVHTKKFLQRQASKRKWKSRRKLDFSKKPKRATEDDDYGLADCPPDISTETMTEKKKTLMSTLRLSETQIVDLEKETRDQSRSEKWVEERRNRLTASNFGIVMGIRRTTNCSKYVRSMLYRGGHFQTKAMQHGHEKEAMARQSFEELFNKKVSLCGLFVDKDLPFLAASPDGLIADEDATIEIKCPLSVYDSQSFQEALAAKKIPYCKLEGGRLKLKENSKYFYQVQGQLHITGRSKCYFIVWTKNWMEVEEIARDDALWCDKMVPKLTRFYEEALAPEIVAPRYGYGVKNMREVFL